MHITKNIQVVGHHGSLYHELENTQCGFQVASEIGCDTIQLDIFLLKCGSLVVFHGGRDDASPSRLDEYFNTEGKDENNDVAYITLLEEVLLNAKEGGLLVNNKLKGPGTA
eukprot:4582302-Ditylum_brightwellii.AAC.1